MLHQTSGSSFSKDVYIQSPEEEQIHIQVPFDSISNHDEQVINHDENSPQKDTTFSSFLKQFLQYSYSPQFNLICYLFICLITLVVMVYYSFFGATVNGSSPHFFSCRSWGYWPGSNCGLNGVDCRPFTTEFSPFRCPVRCTWDQSNDLEVIGSGPYRGDSRICKAAIHAGVIGKNGGCGMIRYTGEAFKFSASLKNQVQSIEYSSWFPKNFIFQKASNQSFCTDLSWYILVVWMFMLFGLSFFKNTNPLLPFLLLISTGYLYVILIGQPVSTHLTHTIIDTTSNMFIVLALGYMLYLMGPLHTFSLWNDMNRKERFIFYGICYVFPFMITLHLNFFTYIPWLNMDLGGFQSTENVTAGTYLVYALVGVVIAIIFILQSYRLYKISLHYMFLFYYTWGVVVALLIWRIFPSYKIHLHHFMLGIIFVPFTRFPDRLSAVCQALAVGLFIQGYAAFGFDTYLVPKPDFLTLPVLKPPVPILDQITSTSANITWNSTDDSNVEAYSLMLNEVEVYRNLGYWFEITNLRPNTTYFVSVATVGSYGSDGMESKNANFTTKELNPID